MLILGLAIALIILVGELRSRACVPPAEIEAITSACIASTTRFHKRMQEMSREAVGLKERITNLETENRDLKLHKDRLQITHDTLTRQTAELDYHRQSLQYQLSLQTQPVLKCPFFQERANLINVYNLFEENNDAYECVTVKNVAFCLHPTDEGFSNMMRKREFKNAERDLMERILTSEKDLDFIDIGGHIGVFTITAASLGRRVLTVEPLLENARHIHRAVYLNGIQENITLVLNALSDTRGFLEYDYLAGHSIAILRHCNPVPNIPVVKTPANSTLSTIYLDDLVNIVHFDQVFLKVDVHCGEVALMRTAHAFFHSMDVRYVLMDFGRVKHDDNIQEMVGFFVEYGLRPHTLGLIALDINSYRDWTEPQVIWIRAR